MLSDTLPLVPEIVRPLTISSHLHLTRHLYFRANELPGMLALLERIRDRNITLTGDLAFVNNWKYFTNGLPLLKDSVLSPLIHWCRSFYPSWSAHDNGPLRRKLVGRYDREKAAYSLLTPSPGAR